MLLQKKRIQIQENDYLSLQHEIKELNKSYQFSDMSDNTIRKLTCNLKHILSKYIDEPLEIDVIVDYESQSIRFEVDAEFDRVITMEF